MHHLVSEGEEQREEGDRTVSAEFPINVHQLHARNLASRLPIPVTTRHCPHLSVESVHPDTLYTVNYKVTPLNGNILPKEAEETHPSGKWLVRRKIKLRRIQRKKIRKMPPSLFSQLCGRR